ncbi:ectoderm-neural cortex protein 1-like isoform X2 [Arctopsyche grandis]|uniref:ectoderm-neural cortex protein 1-like isoform X2 n=1 Tax=Arctopsyche grandis TaxID=121162 RepID=UPI00406DA2F1
MFVMKPKSNYAAKRVAYLYDAMKRNKTYDTGFDVRGRTFYAHLIVLATCSEFFGTNEGYVEDIFSEYDDEVIEATLKYCYTGEISIDEKHVEKLMELANRLEVKIPEQFKTVDLSNCLKVLESTGDSELLKMAMDLTSENFEMLHKTQGFLNLPLFNVIEILKSNDLFVPSEESVFNAVKLWVNHDDANRKSDLAQLMRFVRLSLLSMEFIVYEVMTFCNSCAECMTTIRQEIINKNDKSLVPRETPRRIIQKMALVGGWRIYEANTIDIFDGLKNSWTLSKNIGINKSSFASVLVGDWILIIGGEDSSYESVTSVEYIDLKSGEKKPLKPLNQARYLFSAVTLRRGSSTDVYAIGGYNSRSFISSVERWSSNTGDWEIIAPLLVAVKYHSASVIANKIYITGGQTSQWKSSNKVQMYSVETNSWTYRAQMIQGRHRHSSVAFQGKLYVAGGIDSQTGTNLDSVEHYDPNANVWTAFTKLPQAASGISLGCFQSKLFSMGDYLSDVWEYDETNKSWKASTSLSIKRYYAVAHVIPYDSII